jgi:hypothetical protein
MHPKLTKFLDTVEIAFTATKSCTIKQEKWPWLTLAANAKTVRIALNRLPKISIIVERKLQVLKPLGIGERFRGTMQDEFYAVAFRKKIYRSIDELQKNPDL